MKQSVRNITIQPELVELALTRFATLEESLKKTYQTVVETYYIGQQTIISQSQNVYIGFITTSWCDHFIDWVRVYGKGLPADVLEYIEDEISRLRRIGVEVSLAQFNDDREYEIAQLEKVVL